GNANAAISAAWVSGDFSPGDTTPSPRSIECHHRGTASTSAWRSSRLTVRGSGRGRLEPVGLGQLRVLAGQHLGQVDHDLALLPGGVVLHLAVDHVDAPAVGNGLDDLLGED